MPVSTFVGPSLSMGRERESVKGGICSSAVASTRSRMDPISDRSPRPTGKDECYSLSTMYVAELNLGNSQLEGGFKHEGLSSRGHFHCSQLPVQIKCFRFVTTRFLICVQIMTVVGTSDRKNDVPVGPVIKALGIRSMGGHHRVQGCSPGAEPFLFRLILEISGCKLGQGYFPRGKHWVVKDSLDVPLGINLELRGIIPFQE